MKHIPRESKVFGFKVLHRFIDLGILKRVDDRLYGGEEKELIVPVLCADAKDNHSYFARKQEALGLPHHCSDLVNIQIIAGPLWASPEWWKAREWTDTLLGLNVDLGIQVPFLLPDQKNALNFYYLQIMLANRATGRRRFPYVPHYPCKACFMTNTHVCYELAQLMDAIHLFKQRLERAGFSTVPLFHVHWDEELLDVSDSGMETYFVDFGELKKLPLRVTAHPEQMKDFFPDDDQFRKTSALISRNICR